MPNQNLTQTDKFKAAAREIECDHDADRFKERVGKLVKHKAGGAVPGEGGVRGWALALFMLATECGSNASPTYMLYRDSPIDGSVRIHWATFDSEDSGASLRTYNQENCELAVTVLMENLRAENDGTAPASFWCEKGTFHS